MRASNKEGIFNSYFMYSTSYTTSIFAAPDRPTLIIIGLFKAYFANYAIFGAILEENKQVYLWFGKFVKIVLIASSKAYSNNLSASSNIK